MLTLRKYLCWVYGLTSLVTARFAIQLFLALLNPHSSFPVLRILPIAAMFSILTGIFAAAWWTTLSRKESSRPWGITVSLIDIGVSLWPVIRSHKMVLTNQGVLFSIGVIGLVAFWRRYEQPEQSASQNRSLSIPGDGTRDMFNKMAGVFIFGLSFSAYLWWIFWLRNIGDLASQNTFVRLSGTLLVMLVITAVHESGHLAVGLACGMKLRSFFAGPLQWRIHDGKWRFHFSPKGLFLPEGATGLVPASGDMPRWHYLCMMIGGPLANLVVGFVALGVALLSPSNSPLQAWGFLALVGAWSIALAVGNLLPFRIKNGYSDGALILQFCSDGVLADLQLTLAAIGSTLVSALRPKDYDIGRIRRAARGIEQGHQALLLRLYAFSHFLDSGKMRDAARALAAAESVYHESASDIAAGLYSTFVFGNAFVRQDAAASRDWWERMQSKKPTRFNCAYWRAESALHWIEGNLEEANEAWEKSNVLALELPDAGAYEFERHCCTLLRRAIDDSIAARRAGSKTSKKTPRLDFLSTDSAW